MKTDEIPKVTFPRRISLIKLGIAHIDEILITLTHLHSKPQFFAQPYRELKPLVVTGIH